MNWRQILACLGALALVAGLLLLFSRPPGLEKGAIPVQHQAPPPPKPAMNSSNLYEWQSQEFTNRVVKFWDTNAPARVEDREALDLQNLIIQQTGPRR